MRQCIFCMQWKEEKEFNREHIILEALGGRDHSGVRYSKEDIKRRKVERKFDKRSIKKNWRLQTPVKKQ